MFISVVLRAEIVAGEEKKKNVTSDYFGTKNYTTDNKLEHFLNSTGGHSYAQQEHTWP